MKGFAAFVLLCLLAFQVTDLCFASGGATKDDDPDRDAFNTVITMYSDRNIQNTSDVSLEGTDRRNSRTNTTFLPSDIAGKDLSPNDDSGEQGGGRNRPKMFHDETEGLVVVFVIALLATLLFLAPAFNHCRKSYSCKKRVSVQDIPDLPPSYQELMEREALDYALSDEPSPSDSLLPPHPRLEEDITI